MGSGNRVEELESRVKQLEASVTGLTDELVECKERLRALEAEVDTDDIIEGTPTSSDADADAGAADATESEASKSKQENDEESAGSDGDEIIVA
jgi:ribosomal protein L12E/L44/L45/RPP1/RPP2